MALFEVQDLRIAGSDHETYNMAADVCGELSKTKAGPGKVEAPKSVADAIINRNPDKDKK